jgi:hypothetical protein
MEKETFLRFMKIAMRGIRKYGELKNPPVIQREIEQEEKDNIYSYITVTVENKKHKIEATRKNYSYIDVEGYIKDVPTKSWQLIEREICRKEQNDQQNEQITNESKNGEYEDLPF